MHGSPAAILFAWSGAALFAASLGFFLYSYAVTFGEIAGGGSPWLPIGIDGGLFGLFAIHHSLFARTPLRAWIAARCSPQLERAVYVWAASLMLIVVCAWWQPVPGLAWAVDGPAAWLLRGATVLGLWLTLRSAAMIDVWELAGVRQAGGVPGRLPERKEPVPEFRAIGPYGWVRHPIYLGWFLIVFSAPTMTMTRLVFAVVSSAYVLAAIPLEEATLRKTTNGAYERYAKLVRWKLLPCVY